MNSNNIQAVVDACYGAMQHIDNQLPLSVQWSARNMLQVAGDTWRHGPSETMETIWEFWLSSTEWQQAAEEATRCVCLVLSVDKWGSVLVLADKDNQG